MGLPLKRRTLLAAGCAAAFLPPARAAATVRIGQVLPLTGPLASVVKPVAEGQKALLNAVNAQGGVNGAAIELVTLDDTTRPDQTVDLTRNLLADTSVAALFGYAFVPGLVKAIPLVDERRMPLIGVYNGADILRGQDHPTLFTTTASLRDEIAAMVQNLATLNMCKLAVAYQDNELGRFMLPHVQAVAEERKAQVIATVPLKPDGSNAKEAAAAVNQADPQGILLLAAGAAVLGFMRARTADARVPVYALSLAGTTSLVEQLGSAARGMAFTQIVPYPLRQTTPLSRHFGAAMQAAKLAPTYDRMWGYLNASILVEVLRRTGGKPSPATMLAAVEKMSDVDIGGYRVNYGPQKRHGSSFVEITMVDGSGKFVR
ncbi:ABC transporter substrate-binding protein [Ramlibacter sp. G-1-2-2]|uniref:ABC transporter substrate-binding protein n=1 Tax=Ramlibacter agri TaxID=2728837 RepID=A0A848H554_9BURK|nr:ABC transporter substrate-binding protein [Ramlibacter agri]NML44370.1 ABC transporter substrate-binding protein [Ramlibacter agri]